MGEEHLGGTLWRIDGRFCIRDSETSTDRPMPDGATLFDALKHASKYEKEILKAKKGQRSADQVDLSEGLFSHWGEAWQTPSGKALVSALAIDIDSLTTAQQTKLEWDCIFLTSKKLSKAKQYSAEMKKLADAIKAVERLVGELSELGVRPQYEINPLDRTDPLSIAWEVQQSLIFRQREFVNIIGRLRPQGRLPEGARNLYIYTATRVFLRWFDDGRPTSQRGLAPTKNVRGAIPKGNNAGVYSGPVWTFLDDLFRAMREAHRDNQELNEFFSVKCNQSTPAEVVIAVRDQHTGT